MPIESEATSNFVSRMEKRRMEAQELKALVKEGCDLHLILLDGNKSIA